MFVKKDLRKIPQILAEATACAPPPSDPDVNAAANGYGDANGGNDRGKQPVTELSFSRRAAEFAPSGEISLVLEPSFRPALDNLIRLSLYDCGLNNLAAIGGRGGSVSAGVPVPEDGTTGGKCDGSGGPRPLFPKLQHLDVGRNLKLTALPPDMHADLPSLIEFWCDDCGIAGSIPETLLKVNNLRVLRMTGNKLSGRLADEIGVSCCKELRVLALDGNNLESIGEGVGKLLHLEKLHLRQNNLNSLPEGVPGPNNRKLTMLSLSSNQLTSLPVSIAEVGPSLLEVYANGNQLVALPEGISSKLTGLKKLNLAHNRIAAVPDEGENVDIDGKRLVDRVRRALPNDFFSRFGTPNPETGICTKDDSCVVRMEGNPLAEDLRSKWLEGRKKEEER